MGNIKQINIKNRTYYFFNDINIMGFNSCLIKINKKYYKNICICKSGYIAIIKIDDYESINNVNLLYLIIRKADEYIEENNGKTYFTSTDYNTKVSAKFAKLWDEIKHLIEPINEGKKGEYEKDFMKIKFNSDDNLPFNKMLKLHI